MRAASSLLYPTMSDYYVKTDAGSIGPFSEIELRELVFAGLLKHDSLLAVSPDDKWLSAQTLDLFSIQRIPVPHPPGTVVPQFEVQGLPPVFRGPFKLRELFGFTARGMLHPDALIKNAPSGEWRPVQQYAALMFCLNGDLVRLSADGQLVLRTLGNPEKVNLDNTCAPIELAQQAALKQASLTEAEPPTPVLIDEGYEAEQAAIHAANTKASVVNTPIAKPKDTTNTAAKVTEKAASGRSIADHIQAFLQYEFRLSDLLHPSGWSRRATLFVAASLCVTVAVAAYVYSMKLPKQSDRLKGVWYGQQSQSSSSSSPESSNMFGISLKDDGECIVFDSAGTLWQGGYSFSERHGLESFYDSLEPQNSTISAVGPTHETDTVESTDGYIRFISTDGTFPKIDGRLIQEAFVRARLQDLRLGYLTAVKWAADTKTLEAGWIKLHREQARAN